MSDQPMQGVTTRSLDTSQDIERAGAISTRSGLARMYADQFRADRNQMRRGAVTRTPTIIPDVPDPSDDVTQEQDTTVPGSFDDIIDAVDDIEGDSQGANQVINPGGSGGGGGGGGGGGSGGSDGGGSSGGQRTATDDCPSGWRDSNGCTDAPVGVDCFTLVNDDGELVAIGDCDGSQSLPEGGGDSGAPGDTLPEGAEGGNDRYYYTSSPYHNRFGRHVGTTYTAFDRQNNNQQLYSIGVDHNNRRICRGLLDCHIGGGARMSWFNQQFGLGITT